MRRLKNGHRDTARRSRNQIGGRLRRERSAVSIQRSAPDSSLRMREASIRLTSVVRSASSFGYEELAFPGSAIFAGMETAARLLFGWKVAGGLATRARGQGAVRIRARLLSPYSFEESGLYPGLNRVHSPQQYSPGWKPPLGASEPSSRTSLRLGSGRWPGTNP